jgi:hypothetical protein
MLSRGRVAPLPTRLIVHTKLHRRTKIHWSNVSHLRRGNVLVQQAKAYRDVEKKAINKCQLLMHSPGYVYLDPPALLVPDFFDPAHVRHIPHLIDEIVDAVGSPPFHARYDRAFGIDPQ